MGRLMEAAADVALAVMIGLALAWALVVGLSS